MKTLSGKEFCRLLKSREGTSAAASAGFRLLPRVLAHTNDANGADSVMQSLTERADARVADYLRVNEGYC